MGTQNNGKWKFYDTCCKSCAMSKGSGSHDATCGQVSKTGTASGVQVKLQSAGSATIISHLKYNPPPPSDTDDNSLDTLLSDSADTLLNDSSQDLVGDVAPPSSGS